MIAALWASRQRNTIFFLVAGPDRDRRRDRLRASPAQRVERALLRRAGAQELLRVRPAVDRLRGACRGPACSQRRADVAQSEIEAGFARGPCRGSPGRMAVARTRLSSVASRRDRRQSRSANSGGRQAPHRTNDRPRDRPSAIDAASPELHRGALGPFRQDGPRNGGFSLRSAGLHGLVRADLRRRGLVRELASRPAADPA